MKTILPESINTIDEAKMFLSELLKNGEDFHPEDDATDLVDNIFTQEEGEKLNKLMDDIYNLEGNNGNHANPIFDPCQYILDNDVNWLPDFDEVSKEDAEQMLRVYPREKIINWIKKLDRDACVTDEEQTNEYGRPATDEELKQIFWAEFEELKTV